MTPQNEAHLLCVGKGWHDLVRPLLELAEAENVQVFQVKEKFGGLRFYCDGCSDELYERIDAAEEQSFEVCEDCGKPGLTRGGSWMLTLCDDHAARAAPP